VLTAGGDGLDVLSVTGCGGCGGGDRQLRQLLLGLDDLRVGLGELEAQSLR